MEFSDNTFIVDNGKMNIIDFDGNIINSFDFIFPLKDNRAAVSNNKSWGYINSKGQIVIPLKFERASNFNDEGQALVQFDNLLKIINPKGNIVKKLDYRKGIIVNKNLLNLIEKEDYWLTDYFGEKIYMMKKHYSVDYADDFLVIIKTTKGFDILDGNGAVLSKNVKANSLNNFSEGLIAFRSEERLVGKEFSLL